MLRFRCALLSLVALLVAARLAHGQTLPEPANLRGESAQTLKRLLDARKKVRSGNAAEAIDELQRVLDDARDDLISPDGKHYYPARFIVHQILLTLPPDQLKIYQDRVEQPSRKLLDAGKQNRDLQPLWQLVDRFFVSRPAAEALLVLGDLLFERGEFHTAETLWRRLLPRESHHTWLSLFCDEADLTHPIGSRDPALVRARLVLAAAFQAEPDRARRELFRLVALHPGASGIIAGKAGPLVETLLPFVSPVRPVPIAKTDVRNWPTFSGDSGRTGQVPGRLPHHWPAHPTWTAPLFSEAPLQLTPVHGRPPFGHPIIFDGKVYISDGSRVMALDLRTGTRIGRAFEVHAVDTQQTRDPAFTLSAGEGRVFARLGTPLIRNPRETDGSFLSCFAPAQKGIAVKKVWQMSPTVVDAEVWEGPPLVARGRLWAAAARFEGARVVHRVACFDPVDPDVAPDRPAWSVEVCDSALPPAPDNANRREGRPRHELLTLAGRNLIFCSNSGAIVALSARSGQRAWAFKYPRSAYHSVDAARSPEPAPAVAIHGRVFVAPADADRVFALDAETGDLLWESSTLTGARILGVTGNHVIVTNTGPRRGIRGLNIFSGSHRDEQGGWAQHSGGGLATYGRGLVADDLIIWPTRQGLWFLDPETGRPLAQARTTHAPPRDGLFGNLAYADGVLVIVTPTEVWGYVAQHQPAPESTPRMHFHDRIGRAERDLDEGRKTACESELLAVVKSDFPVAMRAWAAARLLLLQNTVPIELEALLTTKLEAEWLTLPNGSIQSLGQLVAEKSGRIRSIPNKPGLPAPANSRITAIAPELTIQSRLKRGPAFPFGSRPLQPLRGGPVPPRQIFVATTQELLAVPLQGGATKRYAAEDIFTHAVEFADGLIAVGPNAIALYGTERDPRWVFRVPGFEPLPAYPGRELVNAGRASEPAQLTSFMLTGTWLFARLGAHHILALDMNTLSLAWVLGSHGRSRYEPLVFPDCPHFEPHYFTNGKLLLLQLSDGRRWTIRVETGRVLDSSGNECHEQVPNDVGERSAQAGWVQPPAVLETGRIAIVDGPGLVHTLDLDTGKTVKLYSAPSMPSLSGEPPQVRAWNGAVLVAVRRNYGVELDLAELDREPGTWESPAFFDVARINLAHADADNERAYVPHGDALSAITLWNGSCAWTVPLPKMNGPGAWKIRAGSDAVLVFPTQGLPAVNVSATWERAIRSFIRQPFGGRLPAVALGMYDAWVSRTFPVLLLDPQTGQLLKRFDIPARGPAIASCFEGQRSVIVTSDGLYSFH